MNKFDETPINFTCCGITFTKVGYLSNHLDLKIVHHRGTQKKSQNYPKVSRE